MKRKSLIITGTAVLLLVLGLALVAQASSGITRLVSSDPAAQPVAAGTDVEVISISASPAEVAVEHTYWTAERMEALQPLDILVDMSAETAPPAESLAIELTGPAGYAPGGLPDANADFEAQLENPEEWALVEEAVAEYLAMASEPMAAEVAEPLGPTGTSQVFDRYEGNRWYQHWTRYPHRTAGRLVFNAGYCTATVASPNNIIVTAAHCIYDTTNNKAFKNFVFTPAYKDGIAPYGSYPYQNCWILPAWQNLSGGFQINTWSRHDVAVCKMKKNASGQNLSSRVGWMGRSWNYNYQQHLHSIGYPSNLWRGNRYTYICSAESFKQAKDTRGMGCDMTFGASGGPHIRVYMPNRSGAVNYVTGVNSGIFRGTKNMYGPRFTSNNIVPLCNAAGC